MAPLSSAQPQIPVQRVQEILTSLEMPKTCTELGKKLDPKLTYVRTTGICYRQKNTQANRLAARKNPRKCE